MNFWLIALLVNLFVAVLVIIFTYDIGFAAARVIKSMPNYRKIKVSSGEKLFSFLSIIAKSIIPIYNILALLCWLFCDRAKVIEELKEKYYIEMGEQNVQE